MSPTYQASKLACLEELYAGGCPLLMEIPIFPALRFASIGNRAYSGPYAGRMMVRMKKTLRQKWAGLIARKILRSPAFRELSIEFYMAKAERDRARLERWLEKKMPAPIKP